MEENGLACLTSQDSPALVRHFAMDGGELSADFSLFCVALMTSEISVL